MGIAATTLAILNEASYSIEVIFEQEQEEQKV